MSDTKKLVLVTGGTGYVGSHCILRLLSDGYRVRTTARSTRPEKVDWLRKLHRDAKNNLEIVEADLLNPDCWAAAVKDCDAVFHVASPFPIVQPKDEMELIKPAVEGTINVLKACVGTSVKRVVLTSSEVAIRMGYDGDAKYANHAWNEDDWSRPESKTIEAYPKSKVLAELAAWKLVDGLTPEQRFELVCVNPCYVQGPVLSATDCSSVILVKRLLEHDMPMVPKLNVGMVDVRDVALAHVRGLELKFDDPKDKPVPRRRFLLWSGSLWFKETADLLKAEFSSQGYKIPSSVAPRCCIWMMGCCCCDKAAASVLPALGKTVKYDNTRAKEVLGIQFRPLSETVIDTAYSLVEHGVVKSRGKDKKRSKSSDKDRLVVSSAGTDGKSYQSM